ncbi:MAG: hypothetical protein P4M11_04820 [Candidatus Pacebacteria bacterium]|nr:hypothetical protein [Candidatus Paceibacterota bacterium]
MESSTIIILVLLALCLCTMFFRLKQVSKRYSYSSYLVGLYRDIGFTFMLVIYLIQYIISSDSYSLLIIPFTLAPALVLSIEWVFRCKILGITSIGSPLDLSSVPDLRLYVESILEAARDIGESAAEKHSEARIGKFGIEGTTGTRAESVDVATCRLLSMLSAHTQICEASDCVCRAMEPKLDRSVEKGNLKKGGTIERRMWVRFARQQLSDILVKYSKEVELHILLAYIEYYYMKNPFTALTILHKVEDLQPSVQFTLSILYLHREIEEDMIDKKLSILKNSEGSRMLDVRKMHRFMKLYGIFIEEVESCTSNNIAFWTILLEENPDTRRLNNVGNSISAYLKRIHTLYSKIMDADSSNLNFLYKYGVFLRHIAFDELTANTIFSKYYYPLTHIRLE